MEKYSFFNSVNGDRKYRAEDIADYFSKFITNGVFPNVAQNLQIIADAANMTVKVKAGAAWINGYMYYNDSDLILTHDVADGVLNRIDRVVVKLDFQQRLMSSYIKKGAFASSPVAPTLQRDADGYELGLADVYIGAGVLSISQSNVTDLRLNTDLCGMVNSLLQADTTAIFNQYQTWFNETSAKNEADFNTWFDTIKGQLGTDPAGNLQNQINDLAGTGRTTETVKGNADAINNLAGSGRTTETVKGNADALVSHEADTSSHVPYAVATGTANTYAVTLNPAPTSYADGMAITVKINAQNTGASTININSLGAKTIKKSNGNDMASGNLKANTPYTLRYNGTNFILQGEGSSGNAVASDLLSGKTASTDAGDITGTLVVPTTIDTISGTLQETINAGDAVYIDKVLSTYPKLANPATLPAGLARGVAFSSDGTYLAIAHDASPYITIYKRSGDVFTKLADPDVLPTGSANGVAFSSDGTYLAVSSRYTPFLIIYKRNGDAFTKLANPATLPATWGTCVAFSPDTTYLAVGYVITSPHLNIYKRSGDTFTKLSNPAYLPPGNVWGVAFSSDGVYLAVATETAQPYMAVYKRSGDVFTKLADPDVSLPEQANGVVFSPDTTYLAFAHYNSPYLTIYKRSGDTFTKLVNPTTLPPESGHGVAFSSDGTYLAIAHDASPYITIYKRSGDVFTKLADPVLPNNAGMSIAFSVDGTYLVVGITSTPYVVIYKFNFTIKIYKSNLIENLVEKFGAGYLTSSGVNGNTRDVARIFKW